MSLIVEYEGEKKSIKLVDGMSIRDALNEAGINAETVIVKRKDSIVPEGCAVEDGDHLVALKIVSGG